MRSAYPFPENRPKLSNSRTLVQERRTTPRCVSASGHDSDAGFFPTESGMTRVEYSPVKLFSASTVSSNCAGIPDEETVSVHVICSPRPTVSGAESVSVICRGSSSDTADSSGSAAASSTQSVPALFANRYRPSAPASRMPQRILRPAILKTPRPAAQLPAEAPA